MVLHIFRAFWPFGSHYSKFPDLIDKIDALERQLRPYADDTQSGEEAPLFGDIQDEDSSDASRPTVHQMYGSSRIAPGYATSIVSQPSFLSVSTEHELSRLEYSYKPLRMAVQLFRDLVLFLMIGVVWLLDRWYRWLFVALPPGFYITAYKFITRE